MTDDDGTARPGPDGRRRCHWALATEDLLDYHDTEWGVAITDDDAMFERVSLEGFQAGLSWLTVLRKRAALREVFAGFVPAAVAEFTPADVERLLGDPRLIRSRPKIEAVIGNARAALDLPGGLAKLVWEHAPEHHTPPERITDVAAATPESTALSKALKRHGFRFVGPTTAYATMQAAGVVDDHLRDCFRGAAGRG
ncbi:DNA-3-methyladenine glycosylase I [Streptomonospora nanhaiensis]|uniref:DNA-3-methyladenine glycosylase I n=1 Tax=Streptomonospora nanhaiensis TaxID=1323731 RepID=A0A853BQC5_9ACTN|nr:DNA-3-methyladenine glycosylase I [Streptomonospora nanhaiensis]MBV2362769.1 DNA-3-methyladenine glycosylase I [Streptomonospora nanhaiensis]MBX9388750.1 DNA-3-methyladenine glycosylase I [Streptomonospora nanhaiensis]NYI97879.1 DNA-3-methyladenine glycosylase I [Streptomonospora nanhaiensis]